MVRPPGPFPPSGEEADGIVDLGIRLRDTLYRRTVVMDARAALHSSIRTASRSPQQLLMALPSIDAFIDTWPLASLIDEALAQWVEAPNPRSLSILHRGAEVIGSVLGWPRSIDRRWPLPDEAWMRRHVEGPAVIVPRGPRDGSASAAVALDATIARADPVELPKCITAHGDELAERVTDLIAGLRVGVASAVDVDGWVPWDEASQDAAAKLASATDLQSAFSRYGLAALVAGVGPTFDELLDAAPVGVEGDRYRRICDALIVPNLDPDGTIQPVGVLCWDAGYRPVRVNTAAVTVMDALGEHETIEAAAASLETDADVVQSIVRQLVEAGAVSAAP